MKLIENVKHMKHIQNMEQMKHRIRGAPESYKWNTLHTKYVEHGNHTEYRKHI